jgi:hypothetical protein
MFNITLHRSPVSGLKHDDGSFEVVVIPFVVLPILEPLHARKGRGARKGSGTFALLLASCSPSLFFPQILSAREVILYGRYQPTTVPETGRKHIFELQNMFTTLFPPARSFQGEGLAKGFQF